MEYKIEKKKVESLHLDRQNPRLAEFGISANTPEADVLNILWQHMALEEIVTSLVAHGFFDTEPLIVVSENDVNVVLEGNRRLAAVKIVRDPSIIDSRLDERILQRITPAIQDSLAELPVIMVESRQDAWRFIGFKHINGPAKWNSFAKAQHIAQVHKEYNIPLSEISFQVGDTHNTVLRLFQGMMVIEQAEKLKIFSRNDIKRGRLYFSHLYTALQYEGFKTFLGLNDVELEKIDPVPEEKIKNLETLLLWLYGSRKRDVEPVIRSQNPDLRRLEAVIQNREAIAALKNGAPLEIAYEMSRPKSTIFEESLFAAKRETQKAWNTVTEGYLGGIELLRAAGGLADRADELYVKMDEINSPKDRKSKQRLTD